jgi:NAD-dependent SIR2 family protein deacetylase
MAHPLDPSIMLATSMHAQPGVYAVLLGSGVSTASGIPTGWGVVQDLVKRVAALAESAAGEESQHVAAARKDPEAWWRGQFGTDLGYSALLAALAPTQATRQGLLAPFFEATTSEAEEGKKQPSRAHHAIAQLVKRGAVRVIVTTNFDRLMEQALSEVGVQPQIISRPSAVSGMVPLAHAPATLVKLHGDYLDTESLNTDEELAQYSPEWTGLLSQIFDEYGLVISGWSADWDTALVRAIEEASSRRYPLYWDTRSSSGGNATRLLAARDGRKVTASDADALFETLLENVTSLDQLAETPLTTALAVAQLKRYLPEPARRIDLHDLIFGRVALLQQETEQLGPQVEPTGEGVDAALERLMKAADPLFLLLLNGVRYDDGSHNDLWVECMQALLDLRTTPKGTYWDATKALQHFPAQVALFLMSAVAVAQNRDDLLLRLSTEPTWREVNLGREPKVASDVLHISTILGHDMTNALSRWGEGGARWIYPQSHLLRQLLSPLLANVVRGDRLEDLLDDVEYRIAVAQTASPSSRRYPNAGEFVGEWKWTPDSGPHAEGRLRNVLTRPSTSESYAVIFGDQEVDDVLLPLRAKLQEQSRRW